ncbi:MAG: DUF3800 domain-containing protein [candidate division Zixibacteria bacterium]|nr:DUF3800 domain-containing protein [candidate division Zixibacteria bacterium]
MYFMYVDESGDCGLNNSPSRVFVLTGLVIHELRWQACLDELIAFRTRMRQRFGLKLREEFHAAHLITKPGDLAKRISRNDRLAMIRHFADCLARIASISLINVLIDKSGKTAKYDVFETAWTALIQRFENTIARRNFPGPANADDRGLIFCDHTDDKKLMQLLRKRRNYNPVPHAQDYGRGYRNLPLQYVIEDPSFRDSRHSYFIQAVDLAAFLLYQKVSPGQFFKLKSGQNYFNRLDPILCKVASATDPTGIVRL